MGTQRIKKIEVDDWEATIYLDDGECLRLKGKEIETPSDLDLVVDTEYRGVTLSPSGLSLIHCGDVDILLFHVGRLEQEVYQLPEDYWT